MRLNGELEQRMVRQAIHDFEARGAGSGCVRVEFEIALHRSRAPQGRPAAADQLLPGQKREDILDLSGAQYLLELKQHGSCLSEGRVTHADRLVDDGAGSIGLTNTAEHGYRCLP